MDIGILLLAGLYTFISFVACIFLMQRYRWRHGKPSRKSKWGYYPVAAAIALQQLNALTQPQEKHVLQIKYDETTDEDDEGAPKDPTAHLHRQAVKIRRGETIDRLTAIVYPDIPDKP